MSAPKITLEQLNPLKVVPALKNPIKAIMTRAANVFPTDFDDEMQEKVLGEGPSSEAKATTPREGGESKTPSAATSGAAETTTTATVSRVALITGGAKGIGRSVAIELAQFGWIVAINFRESEPEAKDVISEILAKKGKAASFKADVSDPAQCEELVKQVVSLFGRIDALINCAGPYHRVNLLDETIEGWHSMMSNNLDPVFMLSKLVAPGMKERKWGRILAFSMANADQLIAQPQLTAHYIAKVGVLVLVKSLAKVLAPFNITVNCLSPGFVDAGSAPKEELQKMTKLIPAGFVGSTSDVVNSILFLLSDEARYVNGSNLVVSGAWGI